MKYSIDFYKNKNISPDERNAMRKNQSGIWLSTGALIEAETPQSAISIIKKQEQAPLGVNCGFKLRARRA